ncbi:trypsin-like serine protease, partial [Klebsiella pneumoniae]|uniref:trypsin-like serine protease n=1 Tax=Klebsiella pneumoniae TaxID=573 RepID=UPI003013D476
MGCGHTCGAVLLSATKGLTAAHCTDGRDGFEVVAGHTSRNNPESGTVRSEVADTTEHPDYGIPPGIRNDVATLDLADSIPTSQFIGYATLIGQG